MTDLNQFYRMALDQVDNAFNAMLAKFLLRGRCRFESGPSSGSLRRAFTKR